MSMNSGMDNTQQSWLELVEVDVEQLSFSWLKPLEDKLQAIAFTGYKVFEQQFVYHCTTGEDGHLILGDGSGW